ncbi:MAG: hypothetical protein WBN86_10210 [Porticoccaceae bacterium]
MADLPVSIGTGRTAAEHIDTPAWLEREIAQGLQGLVALRLPGAPAEDSITRTLDVWLAALGHRSRTWHEALDAERIRRAFIELYRRCDQWPSPRRFFDHLPPRTTSEAPVRQLTPEQRRDNLAKMKAIISVVMSPKGESDEKAKDKG